MFRKILAMLSFILCLFLLVMMAEGFNPAYEIAAVAGSTPSIDGVIASGEWDDASSVSFNNTVVYVKQDGKNLYVAFNVSDSTVENQDVVAIFIDVDNNGGVLRNLMIFCSVFLVLGNFLRDRAITLPVFQLVVGTL